MFLSDQNPMFCFPEIKLCFNPIIHVIHLKVSQKWQIYICIYIYIIYSETIQAGKKQSMYVYEKNASVCVNYNISFI